jgi:hypothetical protein
MKYPYYIEYITPDWPIMRLPKEIELVGMFLSSEIQDPLGRDSRLEEIYLVLQGEEPTVSIGGNAYGLIIHKDFTKVIYFWPQEEDDPKSECLIETEELRKLILVWLDLQWLLAYARMLRKADERHTDPAIAVPVLPREETDKYTSLEHEEEIMEILC